MLLYDVITLHYADADDAFHDAIDADICFIAAL